MVIPVRAHALVSVIVVALALPAAGGAGSIPESPSVRTRSLAGTGAALHLDPFAGQINPGAMPFVFPGYEVALSVARDAASLGVTGAPSGAPGAYGFSAGEQPADASFRFRPAFAGQWFLNEDETVSLGVAVHGILGARTTYPEPLFDPAGSVARTAVEIHDLRLEPTLGWLVAERHGFGVTPVLAYRAYDAQGLGPFADRGWSADPDRLTDNGSSGSAGYGLRAGYLGEILGFAAVGASYRTRITVSAHEDYAGWLAEQGRRDVPAAWRVGVAFGFVGMGIAVDVERVLHSGVRSLGNPQVPALEESALGNDDGAGLARQDVTLVRLGAWYRTNSGWMLRAGFATGDAPATAEGLYLGVLEPGTVRSRLSFGLARPVGLEKEVSVFVEHGFAATVRGPNLLEGDGVQTLSLESSSWEAGIGLSF